MAKRALLLVICLSLIMTSAGMFSVVAENDVHASPMVTVGYRFMAALSSDGVVYAWGDNSYGVLGNGTTVDSSRPVAVTMPVVAGETLRFSSICAGYSHMIACATDGTVWTWGSDASGQLGNRTNREEEEASATPKQVLGALAEKTVVAVAAGKTFSLALTSDGLVYAWGSNLFGLLGNLDQYINDEGQKLSESIEAYPRRITALDQPFITAIYAGEKTAAALDANGQVWLWGDNSARQSGTSEVGEDGELNTASVPTKKTASVGYTAAQIALGEKHTAILMQDGTVSCFGSAKYGCLGNGSVADTQTAVFKQLASGAPEMTCISAGTAHSAAIGADGGVYVWGDNSSGCIGGTARDSVLSSPTEITSDLWGTPVYIAAGYDNTAVIDDQGLIYTWGENSKGQLGNAEISELSGDPVRVVSVQGDTNLSLGVGAKDQLHHTQILLTATIPTPTFAISIPSTVDFGELTQKSAGDEDAIYATEFQIGADQIDHLFDEKQISVHITTPSGSFCLTDEEYSLLYSVYNTESGGEPLANGDRFAVFLEDGIAKGRLELDQSQITRQGSYSGSMIFTVRVEEREEAQP